MAEQRKKPALAPGETRTVQYLAPGIKPEIVRGEVTIDAELEEIRDAEAKANDVPINPVRDEPTIDPALVKARDEEIKRLGGTVAKVESEKAPAKKAAPSKSIK